MSDRINSSDMVTGVVLFTTSLCNSLLCNDTSLLLHIKDCTFNCSNINTCVGCNWTSNIDVGGALWYRNFFSVYLEVPATRMDEPSYMWVRFVFLTVTLMAGLVGNVLTIVVMTRPTMRRQQISSRFATLACCDLCCCLMRVVTWLGLVCAFLGRAPPIRFNNNHWCRFSEYCFTSIHVAESWLVSFITLERAVAVVFPMRSGGICGQSSGKYFICFCVVCPFVMLSYLPFVTQFVSGIGCATRTFPDMFFHFLITTTAVSALPLTSIFICNVSIIVALKRQNSKVNNDKRSKKFKRVTNMVLAVSLAFLATVFPQASNVMMQISNPKWAWLKISDDVTAVLLDVNYAINFYLYVITGKSLRREIRALLTCSGPEDSCVDKTARAS